MKGYIGFLVSVRGNIEFFYKGFVLLDLRIQKLLMDMDLYLYLYLYIYIYIYTHIYIYIYIHIPNKERTTTNLLRKVSGFVGYQVNWW